MKKLFVAHEMTRNNTLNKVHVAATELPQLLSQNANKKFGEATAQSRCQSLCSPKVDWKQFLKYNIQELIRR